MHSSIYIYIYMCVGVCGACESSSLSASSASATAPLVTNDAVAMRRGAKKHKIECAIKNQWLHFFTFTPSTSCSLLLCLLLSQPFEKKNPSPFLWGDTCTDKRGGGACYIRRLTRLISGQRSRMWDCERWSDCVDPYNGSPTPMACGSVGAARNLKLKLF